MATISRPAQTRTITTGKTSVTPEKLRPTQRIPVASSKVRTTIKGKPTRSNPRPGG